MSLRVSILRIVAEAFPQLVYGYPRTYIVSSVSADGRMDLIPPADAQHLPELRNAEQWNVAGARVFPEQGAEVIVVFRDADPSRYVVIGWGPDTSDTSDSVGVTEDIGRVVRWGDVALLPVGQPPVLTGTVLLAANLGDTPAPVYPVDVSRIGA